MKATRQVSLRLAIWRTNRALGWCRWKHSTQWDGGNAVRITKALGGDHGLITATHSVVSGREVEPKVKVLERLAGGAGRWQLRVCHGWRRIATGCHCMSWSFALGYGGVVECEPQKHGSGRKWDSREILQAPGLCIAPRKMYAFGASAAQTCVVYGVGLASVVSDTRCACMSVVD